MDRGAVIRHVKKTATPETSLTHPALPRRREGEEVQQEVVPAGNVIHPAHVHPYLLESPGTGRRSDPWIFSDAVCGKSV
jgi:hypothetical protein